MPLYEFECSDCGEEFEVLVLDSGEIIKCVRCDSENVGKQFSTFGLASSNGSFGVSESEDSGCCSQSSCCCCC